MSFVPKGGSLAGSTVKLLAVGNKISGSVLNFRNQDPHKIGYPNGWRTGPTEEWYKSQPSTRFTCMEYRKEQERPFFHEYIVVTLDNGTRCRFDRRGDVDTRANAFTFEGMEAEDTAHVINSKQEAAWNEIDKKSHLVLQIHFPGGQDLLTILGICYGVQKDDTTRAYTLTKYNCYFLSWVIVTATARRTADWAVLGRDTTQWEELVRSTINKLSSGDSRSTGIKGSARAFLGRNTEVPPPPNTDAAPFVGMSYLISTLRKALFSTRADIQKSLGQLILQTTVDASMRQISEDSAKKAASEAARNHAGQAARDAAMEAVIETMWRTILASQNGGQLWEDQCKATEEAVWKAASSAADSDAPAQVGDTGPPSWEKAWDTAWSESWDKQTSNGRGQSGNSTSTSDQASISSRAKEAWITAWREACKANEDYVPLISDGVSDYVEKNLPDSLPEVLKIEVGSKFANLLHFRSVMTNSQLQGCIQGRIREHCQFVRTVGIFQDPLEIQEAMRRVWVQALTALDSQAV